METKDSNQTTIETHNFTNGMYEYTIFTTTIFVPKAYSQFIFDKTREYMKRFDMTKNPRACIRFSDKEDLYFKQQEKVPTGYKTFDMELLHPDGTLFLIGFDWRNFESK